MIDPLIGVKINDQYLIKRQLGAGGMGVVYEAENLKLSGRPCAIKILKESQQDADHGKVRFKEELNIISQLRSPHIVQVLDKGELSEGRLYIVMELLEGESLFSILEREGSLSLKRAVQIVQGVLAGLSEAHTYGIIHRDLKPANIYITRSVVGYEIAKILDFGIAKKTQGDQGIMTHTQQILGTPQYMSPEQLQKESLDQRTDLYAVGLLLYELISGEPTYQPDNVLIPHSLRSMPPEVRVMWLQMHANPQPLDIPESLWEVCSALLQKNPEDRPGDAKEVIQQLTFVLEELDKLKYSKRLLQSETEVVKYTSTYESDAQDIGGIKTQEHQAIDLLPAHEAARLVVISEDLRGQEYTLNRYEVIVGRFPESSDIVIPHSTISGAHARFLRQKIGFTVKDLDSANGVLVNGSTSLDEPLKTGDVLTLGNVVVRFIEESAIAGGPPPLDPLEERDETSISSSPTQYFAPQSIYPVKSASQKRVVLMSVAGVTSLLLTLYVLLSDDEPSVKAPSLPTQEQALNKPRDILSLEGIDITEPKGPPVTKSLSETALLGESGQALGRADAQGVKVSETSQDAKPQDSKSQNSKLQNSKLQNSKLQNSTSLSGESGTTTSALESKTSKADQPNDRENAQSRQAQKANKSKRPRRGDRSRARRKRAAAEVSLALLTRGMFFARGAVLRLKPRVSPKSARRKLRYEIKPRGSAVMLSGDRIKLSSYLSDTQVRVRACVKPTCSRWLTIHVEGDESPPE